jgi:hypothetical protein
MAKIKIFNIDFDSSEDLEDIQEIVLYNNFFLLIELELGLEGGKGADVFRFNICDYQGLQNELKNESKTNSYIFLNDYNIIFVESFSYDVLIQELNKFFEEAVLDTNDWRTIAKRLNKYFYWEYENEF